MFLGQDRIYCYYVVESVTLGSSLTLSSVSRFVSLSYFLRDPFISLPFVDKFFMFLFPFLHSNKFVTEQTKKVHRSLLTEIRRTNLFYFYCEQRDNGSHQDTFFFYSFPSSLTNQS